MFLAGDQGVIDFDLDLFIDVAEVLDRHIGAVCHLSINGDLADQLGLFDRAEHASGLGFVACQAYMASTYPDLGVRKARALSLGPMHRSGGPVAAIINAAANFWKHNGEWQLGPSHPGRERTERAFDSIGFPVTVEYPLSGVLAELTTPAEARLMSLVSLLEAWRDGLDAHAPSNREAD